MKGKKISTGGSCNYFIPAYVLVCKDLDPKNKKPGTASASF